MAWYDSPMLQGMSQLTQPQVQAPSNNWNMPMVPTNFGGAPVPQQDNIMTLMDQLYKPQYGMQDRYNELINNYPQRQAPSGLRRLGAALYAMGPQRENPIAAADQFLNYHHYQNLGDWQNQAKNLQSAADNERMANINERQMAYQMAGRTLDERRIREAERQHLEKEDLARKTESRRAESARILNQIRTHPNLIPREINGELVLVDPKPGGAGAISTGYKGLSDQERLDIQNEAAMARAQFNQGEANYRNQNTIDAAASRQEAGKWTTIQIDDPDNPGKKKLVQTNDLTGAVREPQGMVGMQGAQRIGTPGSISSRDPNLAEGRARTLRTQEAKMRPEWSRYFDAKGVLKPPSAWMPGYPDAATRKAISDYILGQGVGLTSGNRSPFSGGGAPSSPLTVQPPNTGQMREQRRNARTGEVAWVVSSDGGRTWRPE